MTTVKLKWFEIRRGNDQAGELLAAFQLFLVKIFLDEQNLSEKIDLI